jgi:hypothetical protein
MRADSDMLKNPSVPDHGVFRHSGGGGYSETKKIQDSRFKIQITKSESYPNAEVYNGFENRYCPGSISAEIFSFHLSTLKLV